jgi:hypothetical protein
VFISSSTFNMKAHSFHYKLELAFCRVQNYNMKFFCTATSSATPLMPLGMNGMRAGAEPCPLKLNANNL